MDNLQCQYCESDITNHEMNDSTMPDMFCSSSCEELFSEHQADLALWEMENS
ncbi:hypothetical protein [Shouchella clausii]|uniref:hypothetical protein n=1 Tax=Shouchella clausii TaxID=79880 RepID=UPI001C733688|nr:hypothetical protein [Shouchella clausii]MBX0320105.1 hypothetical protein [Shouchella clausii]